MDTIAERTTSVKSDNPNPLQQMIRRRMARWQAEDHVNATRPPAPAPARPVKRYVPTIPLSAYGTGPVGRDEPATLGDVIDIVGPAGKVLAERIGRVEGRVGAVEDDITDLARAVVRVETGKAVPA